MWKDEGARSLYMAARDRSQSSTSRLEATKSLGALACNGSEDAAWALKELYRHQETTYEVKRAAETELVRAEEQKKHRGRR